jgi:hypothetical protein
MKKSNTHWWIWVQFAVLSVSLVVNAVLFWRSQIEKRHAVYSEKNDLAWKAYKEFKKDSIEFQQSLQEKVSWLEQADPTSDRWLEQSQQLNSEWLDHMILLFSEAQSKFIAYEAEVGISLPAYDFFELEIMTLLPPGEYAIKSLKTRQDELTKYLEQYQESAPRPRAGPVDAVVERLQELEEIEEKLQIQNHQIRDKIVALTTKVY